MKVLKFTLDAELPEIEYFEETIGLGDDVSYLMDSYVEIDETLGLDDALISIVTLYLTETLGLGDDYTLILFLSIIESLGLGDLSYEPDYIYVFESLGLGDDLSHSMDIYIEIDETLGLGDAGYGYLEINYNLRWRARTKKSTYGYGAAPYGDITSYGDGDVIDELKEFRVKVIRISDETLLRTATIPIVNKQFPDGSAQYTYTVAMNLSDNTIFEPNLRFEIFQVDINDVWSPGKHLDVTVTDDGGDL
jgi:hypothetical protein